MSMESFRARLNEIRRAVDEDVYRRRVLLLCQQQEPKSFDEYSSSGSFRRLEKFESSTYSEVLKAIDLADNNKPVVMKIMRALSKGVIKLMPSATTKGCQTYNDILNELVVTQALSQLHDGVILNGQPNSLFRTHFFCQIQEIKVVTGNLSRTLSKSSNKRATARRLRLAAAQPTDEAAAVAAAAATLPADDKAPSTDAAQQAASGYSSTAESADGGGGGGGGGGARKNGEATSSEIAGTAPYTNEGRLAAAAGGQDAEEGQDADQGPATRPTIKDDETANLPEEERMLMEALPHEYVISVMRHDGSPLWWMMTHKKLSAQQLTSVLVQVIVGLAIAEHVYLYEHRDLHVSNILIKRTSNESIPFMLDGQRYVIMSQGVKATIIDATFSRLTHNGRVYHRDLTSTLRAYGTKKTPTKMSLQNRSYRQMVRVTMNRWDDFTPKTNLIWLTYLCETLMKNDVMKSDPTLLAEVKKIRDCTLKVKTTYDLLGCFPFHRAYAPAGQSLSQQQQQRQPQLQATALLDNVDKQ